MTNEYIERKYINLLTGNLAKFRWSGSSARFRCPFCGDSEKNPNKTRGYLFKVNKMDTVFFFKCHNCPETMGFPRFLERINPILWKEYKLECLGKSSPVTEEQKDKALTKVNRDFQRKKRLAWPISSDPMHCEAYHYLKSRMIPEKFYDHLLYTNDFRSYVLEDFMVDVEHGYADMKLPTDRRIIIPFRDRHGQTFAIQGRAMNDSTIRYVTIRRDTETPKVFGLDRNDPTMPTFITEGPFDSLFLPNALAIGGAGLNTNTLDFIQIPRRNLVVVYDNEPRSKQIVRHIENAIDLGLKVVIWKGMPSHLKDINAMIESGISRRELMNMIIDRTYSGLQATNELTHWKNKN